MADFRESFPVRRGGGAPPFDVRGVVALALVALVVAGLARGVYTVGPESVGVVQRFGRYVGTVGPGLRFKLPFGIDTVTILPVKRQLKMEFGFGSPGPSNPDQVSVEQDRESDIVTGDLNAAHVEWVVQYEVADPEAYLFNMREPGPTLRDLSESVMREVVGDRTVDEVLTIGRQGIETDAIAKLTALVTQLTMGLRVQQVQLKNVHPPAPVQRSFDEVNRAQQEREQMINQANGEYNKVVPRASGEAERQLRDAEGYALKRVNEAEGDVARFRALFEQYDKAPEVTRQRLYLETMAEVLPKLGGKIILDEDARQFLPLMNLPAPRPQPPKEVR
ncbi:MAG: FtsH protease activity modulator HflK [Planctomycetota bacterium]|nr:FtsH protease activity modulator HflK [Planctomycetota bacterium]